MKTLPIIESGILSPVVDYLDRNGANSMAYLSRARIPGELIADGGTIAKKQVYDLLSDVVSRERCPEIGFASFQLFELDHLGPIAASMRRARTVGEALRILVTLSERTFEGNEFFLRTGGETAWLCNRTLDHLADGLRYSQHFTVMVFYKVIRSLANPSWRPTAFWCESEKTAAYREVDDLAHCQAKFDCRETAIAFPSEFLGRPIISGHQNDHVVAMSDASLRKPENSPGHIVRSVERILGSHFLCGELPTLNAVSEMTGLSPSTLKRRLFEDGLTYRQLLDRVRYDAACQMLRDSQLPIQEIALELGYSGANNFIRAFRRLTGATPTDYRRKERHS